MPISSDEAFNELTDDQLTKIARGGTIRQKSKAREILSAREAQRKAQAEERKKIPITKFFEKTPAKIRVKRFLSDHKKQPFTVSKIAHDSSTSKGTTRKYLSQLRKEGRIKRISRGHYIWKVKHKTKSSATRSKRRRKR